MERRKGPSTFVNITAAVDGSDDEGGFDEVEDEYDVELDETDRASVAASHPIIPTDDASDGAGGHTTLDSNRVALLKETRKAELRRFSSSNERVVVVKIRVFRHPM